MMPVPSCSRVHRSSMRWHSSWRPEANNGMSGRLAYLEGYIDGERTPRRLALRTLPAVIGRQADCDLQLVLERISRRHARFERSGDSVAITDLGSINGTFVN